MNILIAYYSRRGGTAKLAQMIKENLEQKGHSVDEERIRAVKEYGFWAWFIIRMFKWECDIYPLKIQDLSKYDVVCLGSPNWTRLSLPMVRYLKIVKGLKYKTVGLFSTTFLWPRFEWYVFSAYLLEATSSRLIEKTGGRFVDSILLSSFIEKWNVSSAYGKRTIEGFCTKLTSPLHSKDYFLEREVSKSNRLSVVLFSLFLFISLICQSILSAFGLQIFTWLEYFYLFFIGLIVYAMMMTILARRVGMFLGKYLTGGSLIIILTLVAWLLEPFLYQQVILGYLLVLIIIGFFREPRAVLFTGLISVLGYIFLMTSCTLRGACPVGFNITLLLLGIIMISLVTRNLQRHYLNLLDSQDEIEKAREGLEVEVGTRTQELRELSSSLERQIKRRTKELEGRIDELERFHKLTVGRELKMIELKKKIKEMEK